MPYRNIDQVMSELRKIHHEQTRRESEDYLEMVMFHESLPELKKIFDNYFGPAIKPYGKAPDPASQEISTPYGGVAQDQTLYHTVRDNAPQVAMIWPWSDGKRVTVKIAQEWP